MPQVRSGKAVFFIIHMKYELCRREKFSLEDRNCSFNYFGQRLKFSTYQWSLCWKINDPIIYRYLRFIISYWIILFLLLYSVNDGCFRCLKYFGVARAWLFSLIFLIYPFFEALVLFLLCSFMRKTGKKVKI